MKFDLMKALDGHPLEFNGKPIVFRSVRREPNGSLTVYASAHELDLPQTFNGDGNPLNAKPELPLTLAEPDREVYVVLYPGNEARYFFSIQSAEAAIAGGKGSGPYTITAKLPWEISFPQAGRLLGKA